MVLLVVLSFSGEARKWYTLSLVMVPHHPARHRAHLPAQAADDAVGQRLVQAERVPNGEDLQGHNVKSVPIAVPSMLYIQAMIEMIRSSHAMMYNNISNDRHVPASARIRNMWMLEKSRCALLSTVVGGASSHGTRRCKSCVSQRSGVCVCVPCGTILDKRQPSQKCSVLKSNKWERCNSQSLPAKRTGHLYIAQ